jgi:antirestriction protein
VGLSTTTPHIYVVSLADYNAGRLHGRWIDADQDAKTILLEVQEMLAESTEPIAEEWAILVTDGFGPLDIGEYESLETVAKFGIAISEHGEAFAAYAEHVGVDYADVDDFEEAYCGVWRNGLQGYAEELFDELYLHDLPDSVQCYIDYEKFAHDLEIGDGYWEFTDSEYQTHVFRPV